MPKTKRKIQDLVTVENDPIKKPNVSADDIQLETDEDEKDLESFLFGSVSLLKNEQEDFHNTLLDENEDDVPLLSFSISTKPGNNAEVYIQF